MGWDPINILDLFINILPQRVRIFYQLQQQLNLCGRRFCCRGSVINAYYHWEYHRNINILNNDCGQDIINIYSQKVQGLKLLLRRVNHCKML